MENRPESVSIFDSAGEAKPYGVFDTQAGPSDEIPDGYLDRLQADGFARGVDASTVRLVKTSEELSLYAARRGSDEICMFVVHAQSPSGSGSSSMGCGPASGPLRFSRTAWVHGEFAVGLVPDGVTSVEFRGVEGAVENNAFILKTAAVQSADGTIAQSPDDAVILRYADGFTQSVSLVDKHPAGKSVIMVDPDDPRLGPTPTT